MKRGGKHETIDYFNVCHDVVFNCYVIHVLSRENEDNRSVLGQASDDDERTMTQDTI